MNRIGLLAIAPFFIAGPALAQHEHHPAPDASVTTPAAASAGSDAAQNDDAASTESPPQAPSEPSAMSWPTDVAPEAPAAEAPMAGMDHSGMGQDDASDSDSVVEDVGSEPAPVAPTDNAADRVFDPVLMENARAQLRQEHGGSRIGKLMLNLGEYQARTGDDGYRWDGEAWYGGDTNRFVVKSEGEGGWRSGVEAAEVQALYSRAIGPYYDVQAGIRYDFEPRPSRTYLTVGFEGVAPYWFETGGALFLSNEGELLGRLEGSYDLRLTQRWILQPRVEMNLSAEDIPEVGIGAGVSNLELGLRLRYQVTRRFAPYVGISVDSRFGATADFARLKGEDPTRTSLVLGVRTWF